MMKKEIFIGVLLLVLIPASTFALFNDDKPSKVDEVPIVDTIDIKNSENDTKMEETKEVVSLDSILLEYEDTFDIVVKGYDMRLQRIIEEASNEYQALSFEERTKTSVKVKLLSKYISEIGELDKNSDKIFYYHVDEFKEQLSNNGYGLLIVNDYIDRYKDAKKMLHRKFLDNTIDMDEEESVDLD